MRILMRSSIIFLFSVCVFLMGSAEFAFADKDFYKANELYENGEYSGAVQQYESIADRGFLSGELFFNIGNAYFKSAEFGKAVLNYERAKHYIPRDADLQRNYELALSKITDTGVDAKSSFFTEIERSISDSFTIEELAWAGSVFFALFLLFLFIYIKGGRRSSQMQILYILFSVVFVVTMISFGLKVQRLDNEAIVLHEELTANFAPLERSTVHFTLYEGAKVRIVESRKDWGRIKRKDGKTGWVKLSDLERI